MDMGCAEQVKSSPAVEALDGKGRSYLRPARTVDDLNTPEDRLRALEGATMVVARRLGMAAVRRIPYGAPVYLAFGLTKPQAMAHQEAALLLKHGLDIGLDLCGL